MCRDKNILRRDEIGCRIMVNESRIVSIQPSAFRIAKNEFAQPLRKIIAPKITS